MKTVKFEIKNKSVNDVRSTIQYIAKTANTKEEAINRLSDILSNVKLGFGGSHVWCSNKNNERLFIIEGF